jgi:uncharacterized protein DUF222/HNH endonuclease
MLATQDVQVSADGEALFGELKRVLHEVDLKLLDAAALAARYAATDHYDEQGYVTAIDSIRINCHQTSNAAADLVAVGRNLSRVPESAQALNQGEIGYSHVKAMARTASAVGDKFDEPVLLAKARENSAGKFYYICKHYRHAADREGFEAERTEMVENRELWVSTCENGAVLISGTFDPEGGAAIMTKLNHLARRSGAHDYRNREKRFADALVELASGGGAQAQIQVTTSLETLLGHVGAPAADMELCSLPISSKTVERLACDCSVTRILLGSDSMVIDVGRARRTVSGPARKALKVRDRGCTWPDCERPASWTSGHHLKHWFHGGTNEPDNLTLLCYRHHWMVHEGRWQILRGDGGRMLTIPPMVVFGPSSRE